MQKAFIANKALLVNPDGLVLVLRDAGVGDHANSKGKWHIPGGRMDKGELPLEGLAREIREEVGLEIDTSLARPFSVGKWGVGGDVENEPIVGIFYAVAIGQVDVNMSDEHTEFKWIDPFGEIDEEIKKTLGGVLEEYRKYAREIGHN